MKRLTKFLIFFILPVIVWAENFELSPIFGENMVLQRKMKNQIWGKATPNAKIKISFYGKISTGHADKNGNWMVRIPVGKAGGPFKFKAVSYSKKNKTEEIVFKNVLVGDVWLCGGQSNMHWEVKRFDRNDAQKAEKMANKIRLFVVKRQSKIIDNDKESDSNRELQVDMPWSEATEQTALNFSAVGFNFGVELSNNLKNIPVGLISCNVGGSWIESWMSRKELRSEEKTAENLNRFLERAKNTDKPGHINRWNSCLYSSMLNPIIGYGIKGVIWYQGESDVDMCNEYSERFKRMVTEWRAKWKIGNFPFYFVQIAPYNYRSNHKNHKASLLQEQQMLCLDKITNTGMAVTGDIGNWKNIHPGHKDLVGKRLSLIAMNQTYGKKIPYQGPKFDSVKFSNGKAYIKFIHGNGLKIKGDTLKGIYIASSDLVFHPAEAKISKGVLIVSSPNVKKAKAVRYGWTLKGEDLPMNLYNKYDLPAPPFRTDKD